MAKHHKCTLEKEGFIGHYFTGNRGKEKAVIYMAGAMCGEKLCVESSEFLRNQGYPVLVLGFYLWKGLPKEMYHIPVEYAERAAKWLHSRGYEKVIIMGTSTGAGYAMLSASLVPEINGAILVSPFDHVMEAMKHNLFGLCFSVYEYRNRNIPYAHYPIFDHGVRNGLSEFRKHKEYDLAHIMRYAYDTAEYSEDNRIKVENIQGDVLMIAPRNDDCWPSTEAVERMDQTLSKQNFPYRHQMTIYENGSHALGYFKMNVLFRTLMKAACPQEKKDPKGCEQARTKSTEEILRFLNTI